MLTLANAARRLKPVHRGRGLPTILVLTDSRRLPDPRPVVATLPAGCGVVLRHYEADPAERQRLARDLAATCRRRRLVLLVAGDDRLAHAIGAAGSHWPEGLARRHPRRPAAPGRALHTAAAHSLAAVFRAAAAGMDAVLVSPVFATRSHPGARPLGPLALARIVRQSPLPVYALGGIDSTSARRLAGSGAAGLACIGALAGQSAGGSGG